MLAYGSKSCSAVGICTDVCSSGVIVTRRKSHWSYPKLFRRKTSFTDSTTRSHRYEVKHKAIKYYIRSSGYLELPAFQNFIDLLDTLHALNNTSLRCNTVLPTWIHLPTISAATVKINSLECAASNTSNYSIRRQYLWLECLKRFLLILQPLPPEANIIEDISKCFQTTENAELHVDPFKRQCIECILQCTKALSYFKLQETATFTNTNETPQPSNSLIALHSSNKATKDAIDVVQLPVVETGNNACYASYTKETSNEPDASMNASDPLLPISPKLSNGLLWRHTEYRMQEPVDCASLKCPNIMEIKQTLERIALSLLPYLEYSNDISEICRLAMYCSTLFTRQVKRVEAILMEKDLKTVEHPFKDTDDKLKNLNCSYQTSVEGLMRSMENHIYERRMEFYGNQPKFIAYAANAFSYAKLPNLKLCEGLSEVLLYSNASLLWKMVPDHLQNIVFFFTKSYFNDAELYEAIARVVEYKCEGFSPQVVISVLYGFCRINREALVVSALLFRLEMLNDSWFLWCTEKQMEMCIDALTICSVRPHGLLEPLKEFVIALAHAAERLPASPWTKRINLLKLQVHRSRDALS